MPQNSPIVTDGALLEKLNSDNGNGNSPVVTDPELLNQLNGSQKKSSNNTVKTSGTTLNQGTTSLKTPTEATNNNPPSALENTNDPFANVQPLKVDVSKVKGVELPPKDLSQGQIDIKNLPIEQLPENITNSVELAKKGGDAISKNNILDAKQQFQDAIQTYPQNIVAVRGLGDVAAKQGDTGEAIAQYTNALHISGGDTQDLNNIAQQQLIQANKLLSATTIAFPKPKTVLGNQPLKTAEFAMEESRQLKNHALFNINLSLNNNPNDAPAWETKAAIYQSLNNSDEALKNLTMAAKVRAGGSMNLLFTDANGEIQFKPIEQIIQEQHAKKVNQLGEGLAGAIDVPNMLETLKQGFQAGGSEFLEGAKQQAKSFSDVANGDMTGGLVDFWGGLLKGTAGSIKMGLTAMMVGKPIAGYTFLSGMGLADEVTNDVASKVAFAPLESISAFKSNSPIWEDTKFMADQAWGLFLFHKLTGGMSSEDAAKGEQTFKDIKEGNPTTVEGLKIVNDATHATLNNIGAIKRLQDATDEIGRDVKIQAAQKRLGIATSPELLLTDAAQRVVTKIRNGEPVLNNDLEILSSELHNKYKTLSEAKTADNRQFTTEQYDNTINQLSDQITALENAKNEQAANEDFVKIDSKTFEPLPSRNIPELAAQLASIKPEVKAKIPTDMPVETKVKVAPLIEEKQTAEQKIAELQKEKAALDENFQPAKDSEIKTEEAKIESANTEIKRVVDESKSETPPSDVNTTIKEGESVDHPIVDVNVENKIETPNAPSTTGDNVGSGEKVGEHRTNIENKFREQFKAKGVSDEQIDGALALMDARAKSAVSRGEVKSADEWYQKIADVRGGEFQAETPKQYQLPNGDKVLGVPQSPEVVNGFYSPLEKQLIEMKADKLPAKQWADKIGGEEAKWSPIEKRITPEIRNIFDKLLSEKPKEESPPPTPKVSDVSGGDNTQQPKIDETAIPKDGQGGGSTSGEVVPPSEVPKVEEKAKEGTNTEKAKVLADKIRGLKSKPLQLKDENGNLIDVKMSGVDFNPIIEAIAKGVEKGGELLDVIKKELEDLKWYQALTDKGKDAVSKQLEDHFGSSEVPVSEEANLKELKLAADDKGLLNRLVASDKVSDTAKAIFEKEGLKYEVHNQEEARDLASSIVKEFGGDEAILYAEAHKFGGDINSAIFGEAIDSMARREESATDTKVKVKFAKKWADYAIRYDDWLRQAGRGIAQAYNFYKNSELGLRFAVEKSNAKYIEEAIKPIEENLKAAFEDFKKQFEEQFKQSSEFKKAVTEEAQKITTKEKAKVLATKIRGAKLDKDIMLSSIPFAKQVINGAIEVMAKAVEAGGTIAEAVQKGIEHMKSTDWYKGLTDADKVDAEPKLQGYLEKLGQDKPKPLKETDSEKLLTKWKTKLGKLTERQRTKLLKRAGLEMIENGALDYEDFRKMYAEEAGLDVLTEVNQAKLKGIVSDIKSVEDAIKNFDESTPENFEQRKKELYTAQEKGRRVAKAYSDFFRKQKNFGDQYLSYMRLNSLPILSLMTNLGQYPFYQPLRFIETAIGTPLDFALTKLGQLGNAAFEKTGIKYRLPTERTVNILGRQLGAWSGFKLGLREAIQDLRRGVTDRDYFRKEINESIKPARAIAEMVDGFKGERKLSFSRWASNTLEATSGAFAEGAVRFMNLFDKPLRYMAEQAKAEEIGRRLGLKGTELQKFIIHQPEKYQEILRAEGEKAVFQQSSTVQKVINSAKQILDEETGGKSKYIGALSKAIFYANQPFLNTPINMFNTVFDYAMPEITFVKGLHAVVTGNKARGTLLLQRAIVGKTLAVLATTLAANGIITPSNDNTNKEREFKDATTKGGRFNQSAFNRMLAGGDPTPQEGDVTFDMTRLGIFGTLMLIHADKMKDKTAEEWKQQSYLDKTFATLRPTVGEGLQNGVFRGTSAIAEAIQTGNMNQILPNMANIYMNALYPAAIRDAVRAGQDYLYRTKADTWTGTTLNEVKRRFGIVKDLPKVVNIWGDPVPATPPDRNAVLYYLFDVTKEQQLNQPQFGWEISDLYAKHRGEEDYISKIMPSDTQYKFKYNDKEYDLKGKDQETLDTDVGHARKTLAQGLISYGGTVKIKDRNDKESVLAWSSMNDDEKATALKTIYEQGYEQGKQKYLSSIGVPIKTSSTGNTDGGGDGLPPN